MRQRYFLLLLAGCSFGQTLVDLRTRRKGIDSSESESTRPVEVGTILTATHQVGQLFFNSTNLYSSAATNVWTVESGPGTGSGNSGGSMASQLGDLQAMRTSSTVLSIGTNCSATTPCNVRFGSTVYSITSGATVTLSGSRSGMLYVYVSTSGTLTVGNKVAATCHGCAAQPNVTSFPPDSVPIATWGVSNGKLDPTGGQDFRAVLGPKNLIAGLGVTAVDTNGTAMLSADTTLIGFHVAAPATSSTACTAGNWSCDSNYIYVCVATNTWRRSALSSW